MWVRRLELVHRLPVLRRCGTAGGMRRPGSKFTPACRSDPGSPRARWPPEKEAAPYLGGLPFDVRPGRGSFWSVMGDVGLCPPARPSGSSTALSPGKRTAIPQHALWVDFPVVKEGTAVIEGVFVW